MVDEKQDKEVEHSEKPRTKQKKGKKLLIIIAVATLVLASAGGFIAYSMLSGGKAGTSEAEPKEKSAKEKSVLVPIEPFVVNLTEHGRYLKITMQFEIIDGSYQDMVTQKTPNLRDAIITLMSSKSSDAISGPEGKFQLKDEILLRANQAMGKEVFKNIYFTEFVMQ